MLATITSRRLVPGSTVDVALAAQRAGGRLEGDDQRAGDDRRLHEEDRPPVEQLGEHAAERRTDRHADGAGQRPPPPRPADPVRIGAGRWRRAPAASRRAAAWRRRPARHGRTSSSARLSAKPATSEAAAKIADAERRRATAGGPGGGTGRRGRRHNGDDEGVRREHPRHADDRRVELAVEVGEGEGDDRRVGEGQAHGADQQRGHDPLPRRHGITVPSGPVRGSAL